MPIDPAKQSSSPASEQKVDPNIQIKFTIIFGILAFIPFVLFYFYGLEVREEKVEGGKNPVPQVTFTEVSAAAGIGRAPSPKLCTPVCALR